MSIHLFLFDSSHWYKSIFQKLHRDKKIEAPELRTVSNPYPNICTVNKTLFSYFYRDVIYNSTSSTVSTVQNDIESRFQDHGEVIILQISGNQITCVKGADDGLSWYQPPQLGYRYHIISGILTSYYACNCNLVQKNRTAWTEAEAALCGN